MENNYEVRSIARQLARELSEEELNAVAGGTTSCCGEADDCDQQN